MARFCFVSLGMVAHCDLGGRSFIRTAQELERRGHTVEWVFSGSRRNMAQVRAKEFVEKHGITIGDPGEIVLRVKNTPRQIVESALVLREYIEDLGFDCLVVDRNCVAAPFSAHGAEIPWVVVGTDGRDWSLGRVHAVFANERNGGFVSGRMPGKQKIRKLDTLSKYLVNDNFMKPNTESRWASSPFLNISFFPNKYYEDGAEAVFSEHSHFVGCGAYSISSEDRSHVLVTFGNTFDPDLRRLVAIELRRFLLESDVPVLLLTGSAETSEAMREVLAGCKNLIIEDWMPYDQVYRSSLMVVGHGGTSHLWYGMREGIPLLAVPSKGDQAFGALQIDRMGIGRVVLPTLGSAPAEAASAKQLADGALPRSMRTLLGNEAVWAACDAVSRTMRAGGGVSASADLIERLARERRPITECTSPACCC